MPDETIEVDAYVNRKGEKNPTGIVEHIEGVLATVYWGTADGKQFREELPLDSLVLCEHEIVNDHRNEDQPIHRNVFDDQ